MFAMLYNDFIIDKITNSIEDHKTGKSYETLVIPVCNDEMKVIHKKDGWQFNWKKEYKIDSRQIFKLIIEGDTEIQGLISVQEIVDERFIEMHLIESAPHNFGKNKRFLGVPANMVAFVCKKSFELGYDGFAAFNAKTRLVEHYRRTLGAQLVMGNNRMVIFPMQARILVNSYYKCS
jgi:hypothetical protein